MSQGCTLADTLLSDSTAISLQNLAVLQSDVSEVSLGIKNLDGQLTQASTMLDELHSVQKGRLILSDFLR